MVKVFGRHQATGHIVSGAYKSQFSADEEWKQVINAVDVRESSIFALFCLSYFLGY